MLRKLDNKNLHENAFSGSQLNACGHKDGSKDG
jgi:hypothetical protein